MHCDHQECWQATFTAIRPLIAKAKTAKEFEKLLLSKSMEVVKISLEEKCSSPEAIANGIVFAIDGMCMLAAIRKLIKETKGEKANEPGL